MLVIQIHSAFLSDGIAAEPSSGAWLVICVAVLKEIQLDMGVFGAKPEGVIISHRPPCPNEFTERAVLVLRDHVPICGSHQGGDISVPVIRRETVRCQ